MKKLIIISIITVLLILAGVWGYQYLNPVDTVVDEELPTFEFEPISRDSERDSSASQDESSDVDQSASIEPVEIRPLQRDFQQGDSTYSIEGRAIVTQQGDQRLLSLADFAVTAGPDLFVYIVQTEDTSNQGVKDAVGRADFINIATLRGNVGNQNYEIPEDIDLDGAVISIWCRQFARNFGHAAL